MLKFGTSGIRALVQDLTDYQVYLITSAFLKYAGPKCPSQDVYIGIDLRESSPKILNAVTKSIVDAGKKVFYCGKVPTPAMAHFALAHNSLSIMVTGSHIPSDRNGIKFYLNTGETLKSDDSQILNLYHELINSGFRKELFSSNGNFLDASTPDFANVEAACIKFYEDRYLQYFGSQALNGLNLVFYAHSTIARDIFPEILSKMGASVKSVGRSDTFVAVDTEAVESIDRFGNWINEFKADALISTDGDADRPLVVDNNGNLVPGDTLGMLTCRYLQIESVALPISCNSSINEIPGLKQIRFTKIGSPFVIEELNQLALTENKVAGYEANGGFILKSSLPGLTALPTRDSLLPVLCALATSKKTGKPLSELAKEVNKRFTASILVKDCPTDTSQKILKTVAADPASVFNQIVMPPTKDISVNTLDGVRISSPEFVVHFRPSGNAAEFRCYTEAESLHLAQEIAERAKKYISGFLTKA